MQLSNNERITKRTYDSEPEAWMLGHSNLEYWRQEFERFDSLCKHLGQSRRRILDIGCGFGRDYRLFRDEGYEYVGLDFSEGLLEEARRLNPGAQFVLASMRNLPFKKNSFDGFWAVASPLHIEKKYIVETLSGIREILVPDSPGLIVLKEGEGEGLVRESKIQSSTLQGARFFAYYSIAEFTHIVESAGFLMLDFDMREERRRNGEKLIWIEFYVVKPWISQGGGPVRLASQTKHN